MKAYAATGGNGTFVQVEDRGTVDYADTVGGDTNLNMTPDQAVVYLENKANEHGRAWQNEPVAGDWTAKEIEQYVGA